MHYSIIRACTMSMEFLYDPNCVVIPGMEPLVLAVASAIKKLRSSLGDSQQAFATRLGLSVRAIANYEGGRQPGGEILLDLHRLAVASHLNDVQRVFAAAFRNTTSGRIEPMNDEERALVRMVVYLLRNREFVPKWPRLAQELVDSLEVLVKAARSSDGVKTDLKELEDAYLEASNRITPFVQQELEKLARERSKKTKQSFEQAYVQVLLEHPELYKQYQEEKESVASGGADSEVSIVAYGRPRLRSERRPGQKTRKS